jgi:hypothetical protein
MSVSPIVVDIETAGLENVAEFLEPVQAAKNLVDPKKIEADIAARTADRNRKIALDYNVGRIVAIGWWTEDLGTEIRLCQDYIDEGASLRAFWRECRHRTIVGFNIKGFDLRYMVQRSRYLGVPYPLLDFSKYTKKGVTDLYLELTFSDAQYDQGVMRRSLHAFCKRFGLEVTDDIKGADIPALVAAGEWGKVEAHVRSDVALTVALARKLGVVNADVSVPVL